ncbi:alkylation response protein AidB-like acyl-CoA dehydrogenase [Dongia mobilis]|uniref:3-methylmercaptopropionyl-CoA dehydrogenase n=1 Tax=Dongia mobilis TaxID=578943 RepID=A0A4R6X2Y3_9PROT|nr:acyl-CoA dehydrogenase C-terminal domain-containing protein [Dongia mobilis]TDQ86462.1 alkylation response protein AidB-like acyl-CoA dehydrogenase [Dongia mobilis]
MPAYKAPLREIRFVLNELLEAEKLPELVPDFADATGDTVEAILEEAGKFCEEVLQPLNHPGDEEGCHFDNGTVTTPKGFREAYATFIEGGWTSLPCDPAYGGQGLPKLINFAVEEMICSANLSFGMYPGLSNGNYNAIHAHGSDEQKALYLPKLVDGSWTGTMCLTEPHCGTDLGLCKTRAEANPDGSYRLYGTKIFISAGEHDFTENIIHLVLARLPDAPAGIRGISLFVCPKFIPDADGKPGTRNPVVCGSIEKKMGIKASSTCVMNFDGAQAWLVGKPHKGMSAMFTMMNTARLAVGMQGLGIAEAAYQGAVTYARDRLQMRALTGAKFPEKPADPIIVHPDVRRMLLTMRSITEGCRALAYWIGYHLDLSQHHPDIEKRQESDDLVALMTPIVKAFLTDHGFHAANLGVQVYGGHGYIREWGMEQLVRDARITQIYEGTNGIQALDLVGRKLPTGTGRLARRFFHPVADYIEQTSEKPEMAEYVLPLAKAFAKLQQATAWIAQAGLANPNEAGAAATDYQRLFALTALGFMWCRMVEIALARKDDDRDGFYAAKVQSARFYMARILPETNSLFTILMAGSDSLMAMPAESF